MNHVVCLGQKNLNNVLKLVRTCLSGAGCGPGGRAPPELHFKEKDAVKEQVLNKNGKCMHYKCQSVYRNSKTMHQQLITA